MKSFKPARIYYEPAIFDYELGRKLMDHYEKIETPVTEIKSHNYIESLRTQHNANFTKLKQYLIIGVRKTHKYTDNHKVSDYIVPYTSSGCPAMCTYCYLVCNFNTCSYLRLFVNREEMMTRMIKKAQSTPQITTFEIGSNSDLVMENTITGNLPWTINTFNQQPSGKLTFPTKFDMVDDLLPLNHQGRIIPRVSLNPELIINRAEIGTSKLDNRIEALNKLCQAGYPCGVLVAPIIFIENWQKIYEELFILMADKFTARARQTVFFEAIFMTYSYIHNVINNEALPNTLPIYNRELMAGRGRGKYCYKEGVRQEGERFLIIMFEKYFPENKLLYVV